MELRVGLPSVLLVLVAFGAPADAQVKALSCSDTGAFAGVTEFFKDRFGDTIDVVELPTSIINEGGAARIVSSGAFDIILDCIVNPALQYSPQLGVWRSLPREVSELVAPAFTDVENRLWFAPAANYGAICLSPDAAGDAELVESLQTTGVDFSNAVIRLTENEEWKLSIADPLVSSTGLDWANQILSPVWQGTQAEVEGFATPISRLVSPADRPPSCRDAVLDVSDVVFTTSMEARESGAFDILNGDGYIVPNMIWIHPAPMAVPLQSALSDEQITALAEFGVKNASVQTGAGVATPDGMLAATGPDASEIRDVRIGVSKTSSGDPATVALVAYATGWCGKPICQVPPPETCSNDHCSLCGQCQQ